MVLVPDTCVRQSDLLAALPVTTSYLEQSQVLLAE